MITGVVHGCGSITGIWWYDHSQNLREVTSLSTFFLICHFKPGLVKPVGLVDRIEMRKTDCFGKTRLVPHVPSSS